MNISNVRNIKPFSPGHSGSYGWYVYLGSNRPGSVYCFFVQEVNRKLLDTILAFAAGAMIFLVVEELIP